MHKYLKRMGALVLGCSLILFACGGDGDDKAPVGPEENVGGGASSDAVFLTGKLIQTFQGVFLRALFADTLVVAGASGTVQIGGNTWILNKYSPDGELFLDGTLDVGKDLIPNIPVVGTLTLSGTQEGTMVLDMLVSVGVELTVTGTIIINEVEFNIADLIAAGAATGEADAVGG